MDFDAPLYALGGLSAAQFMRRHWQRKPALMRQAAPAGVIGRTELFALAAREDIESRLLSQKGGRWQLRHGPFKRLPALRQPGWTLLVQGVDVQLPAARALMDAYRFLPDARLDDVMVSWASPGGGVGPHFDAYDVFLIQLAGRRRWRIGRQRDLRLREGLPLKILADFQPEQEFVLEAGDILYLPPRWAHDGVAEDEGDCITASVGFRAPSRFELADALLPRLLDPDEDLAPASLAARFSDAGLNPSRTPASMPAELQAFARDALQRVLDDPQLLARALGEWLSEPKTMQHFAPQAGEAEGVRLAPASRMLYDRWHVFLNGESFRAGGRDARLMQRLADRRALTAAERARLSPEAQALLLEWQEEGWLC